MFAYDNINLFVSTPDGKDAIHKTVEIGILIIPFGIVPKGRKRSTLSEDEFEEPNSAGQLKDDEIAPYPKELTIYLHFGGSGRREEKSEFSNH